jgi:hypothetical protein
MSSRDVVYGRWKNSFLQNKWESRRIEYRFSVEIVPYSYTINSQHFECHCDICLIQLQWYICRCLSVGLWILHCWNIQISPSYLVDHRLTFRPLFPPHCIICPTSNYSIWLPICYIKTIPDRCITEVVSNICHNGIRNVGYLLYRNTVRFPRKNDIRFVLTPTCFVEGSCFIYVICIYLRIVVFWLVV